MRLRPEEPSAGPWRVAALTEVVELLLQKRPEGDRRPFLLGVDGRSSSGKTTLANKTQRLTRGSAIVHTDDVAWHHSMFGWDDLLIRDVITPLRQGQPLQYRPPAWDDRHRSGAVTVPAGCSLVIIEGVGVGRRELVHLIDALVWVQADLFELERREAARIRAGEVSNSLQQAWLREELPFLADQRPWERADVTVAGTSVLPHDSEHETVISDRLA